MTRLGTFSAGTVPTNATVRRLPDELRQSITSINTKGRSQRAAFTEGNRKCVNRERSLLGFDLKFEVLVRASGYFCCQRTLVVELIRNVVLFP